MFFTFVLKYSFDKLTAEQGMPLLQNGVGGGCRNELGKKGSRSRSSEYSCLVQLPVR